jgi:hypothetical protein
VTFDQQPQPLVRHKWQDRISLNLDPEFRSVLDEEAERRGVDDKGPIAEAVLIRHLLVEALNACGHNLEMVRRGRREFVRRRPPRQSD